MEGLYPYVLVRVRVLVLVGIPCRTRQVGRVGYLRVPVPTYLPTGSGIYRQDPLI